MAIFCFKGKLLHCAIGFYRFLAKKVAKNRGRNNRVLRIFGREETPKLCKKTGSNGPEMGTLAAKLEKTRFFGFGRLLVLFYEKPWD